MKLGVPFKISWKLLNEIYTQGKENIFATQDW